MSSGIEVLLRSVAWRKVDSAMESFYEDSEDYETYAQQRVSLFHRQRCTLLKRLQSLSLDWE